VRECLSHTVRSLGMTHDEVRRKFDEIIAFAEIDEFHRYTPRKRYSSGMYHATSHFAVAAAHLRTGQILIVDEVLAGWRSETSKESAS